MTPPLFFAEKQSRRKQFLYGALTVVLCIALAACSTSTQERQESGAEGSAGKWYNQGYLKTLFGDFEPTEVVVIADPQERAKLVQRGFELTTGVAACGSCHGALSGASVVPGGSVPWGDSVPRGDSAAPLSGGRLMQDRFGQVRAANITSHPTTGVGAWNVFELMRAIRSSIDREGRPLSIDLHRGYRWMSDQDALAISMYLLATPPVDSTVDRRRLGGFERNRWGLFPQHEPVAGYVPALPEVPTKQFGRYLAHSVAQCGVCHTQSGGILSQGKPFAGPVGRGPIRSLVRLLLYPNPEEDARREAEAAAQVLSEQGKSELGITKESTVSSSPVKGAVKEAQKEAQKEDSAFPIIGPDIRGSEGLREWSEADLVTYLSSGRTPAGEVRDHRLCPWGSYQRMSPVYKQALAAYIKSL